VLPAHLIHVAHHARLHIEVHRLGARVVFDALAVFLVPWLLVLAPLGLPAFWGMAGFVGIIALGWLYAYREGVLEWK
jgi:hypothetical protein